MTGTFFYFFPGPVISTPPFVVYGMEHRRRDLKWHGPCGSHVQGIGCRAQLFLGLRRGKDPCPRGNFLPVLLLCFVQVEIPPTFGLCLRVGLVLSG